MKELEKKVILGIGITNANQQEILEYISGSLNTSSDPYYITTPNPEIMMYAASHPEFKSILNQARIAICDGIGLWAASKVLGKAVKARITGVDLLESICKYTVREGKEDVRKPITVGLLGAGEGVALKTAKCLIKRYPGLRVVFVSEEWDKDGFANALTIQDSRDKIQEKEFVNHESRIMNQNIDILFVAYGFPKQEQWMAENIGKLPVSIMMGVGGAFDFISGKVGRAPKILRSLGLEWLYRLFRQPWRIVRQLALVKFVLFVGLERLRSLLRAR